MVAKAAESKELWERRIEALKGAMKPEELSAMLFYSSGQLSMLEVNAVLWISGVVPIGPHTGVLLRPSGEATMIISNAWDEGRVRAQTWIEDIRVTDDFVKELASLSADEHLAGNLGIAGHKFMPSLTYRGIEAISNLRPQPADSTLNSLARSPGTASLPVLEHCAAIADAGFSAIVENARVGMYEYELAAEMDYAMRSRGAEDNFGMLTASDHSHCAHPPQDRKIQAGDVIIAEITPALKGHFIQLCRTAVVGKASPLLREKFA
ncbi:MAG TPA: M24 family metallopeptidase, partial [Terriglobales bacterium]|nr:M24 family metallopeptidase [Terriglobales bacterium]